jgi:autotransporter adhesin
VAVGAGSNAARDNSVDFGGRQLTGLAEGTQDGDASTMGQLRQATADTRGYTDKAISTLDAKAQKMMSGVGAMAMAASALVPNARAEGNFSISAAAGHYNGESAVATGINYYVSNQLLLNARVSLTSSGPAKVGAAVGMTWGF